MTIDAAVRMLPGVDTCSSTFGCFTEQCAADNSFCWPEAAFCATGCRCYTTIDGAQLCGEYSQDSGCPVESECDSENPCTGEFNICADVSCCGDGGFVGLCVSLCTT